MAEFSIRKGLDLPITGEPVQEISPGKPTEKVAIVAADFNGMKAKFRLKVGAKVKRGEPIFDDRKNPGVIYTAPGAGEIVAINRGAKRALVSVVIALSDAEKTGELTDVDHYPFESYTGATEYDSDALEALMVESGMWTAFRSRPFNRIPELGSRPHALFMTCTDSEPLSPDVAVVLKGNEEAFKRGAEALTVFASKESFLCVPSGSAFPTINGASTHGFSGKHPSGLAGTHINKLYPVTRKRVVWTIHLQDIIALGNLLKTGKIDVKRVVSVAGPPVKNPRLISTRIGADVEAICTGEYPEGDYRIISGSPLSGRTAMGEEQGFLGRHHRQITLLREGKEREFIGWLLPGKNRFSSIPIFLSALIPGKKFAFSTSTNGEHREMVPIGMYERVMPLDILPTFLLRAMEIGDLENAEKLGALELDQEDLGLCSFVCPGKQDYGRHLQTTLDAIYKEG